MGNDNINIATKYQVELNSKYSNYSKQGINKGNNTSNTILNIKKEQANNNNNNNKESE